MKQISTSSISDLKEFQQLLSNLFEESKNCQYPIAIWQQFESSKIEISICCESEIALSQLDCENSNDGFAISCFDNFGLPNPVMWNSDLHLSWDKELKEEYRSNQCSIDIEELRGRTEDENEILSEFPSHISSTQKQEFIELVERAQVQIKNGNAKKIVPARSRTIKTKDTHPVDQFIEMCDAYPQAFKYLLYHPSYGVWIGATPEVLLEKSSKGRIKIIALAGTQKKNVEHTKDAMWRQKEIEEQALVSRYIINRFKEIRVREFEDIGPKTVVAGDLMHLQTEFIVDEKETNFEDLANVLAKLLHPTSAVCGMPQEASRKFIEENENLDRSLYTGFLGPIKSTGEASLYVNLRCAQLFKGKAILYAGAGVTEDSDAEAEWEETELKCETMAKILGK